jgi:hypothetical protein
VNDDNLYIPGHRRVRWNVPGKARRRRRPCARTMAHHSCTTGGFLDVRDRQENARRPLAAQLPMAEEFQRHHVDVITYLAGNWQRALDDPPAVRAGTGLIQLRWGARSTAKSSCLPCPVDGISFRDTFHSAARFLRWVALCDGTEHAPEICCR